MMNNEYIQKLTDVINAESQAYRIKHQLTRRQLAARFGIDLTIIQRIENRTLLQAHDGMLKLIYKLSRLAHQPDRPLSELLPDEN